MTRIRRRLLYMAHPLAGDVESNLARAKRWLRYLRQALPHDVVIAPWLHDVEVCGDEDSDPRAREAGLVRDEITVAHCDGVVLVGGVISSGMNREAMHALSLGKEVISLVPLGPEPPPRSG